jgi:hypothetical protein
MNANVFREKQQAKRLAKRGVYGFLSADYADERRSTILLLNLRTSAYSPPLKTSAALRVSAPSAV